MATPPGDDYQQVVAAIKADFGRRLAEMAAEPKQWLEFIDAVADLGARYSLGNQILLMTQAAERGIEPRWFLPYGNKQGTSGWKAHGRHVRHGERGFRIWAPVKRRPSEEQAAAWEAAGRTVSRDGSGRPAVQVVGFRLTRTFELSQTDGHPFEPPTVYRRRRVHVAAGRPELLTGDDPTGAYPELVALIRSAGYTVEAVAPGGGLLGAANGITLTGPGIRAVQIRDDLAPAHRVKTVVHELAHIRCGHTDQPVLHRGRAETEAESVAHIVCRALGVDSRDYSDAYVFGWAGGDLELVQDCAATVVRVARQILTDLTPPDPGEGPDGEGAAGAEVAV